MKKILLLLLGFTIAYISNASSSSGVFVSPVKGILTSPVADTINPSEVLKNAFADLKNLSRSERKLRIREVKNAIHEYRVAKKANSEPSTDTLLLVILAILLPPLAVYLHEGKTNNKFWISLILTLLFFIPGVIYALIVILDKS